MGDEDVRGLRISKRSCTLLRTTCLSCDAVDENMLCRFSVPPSLTLNLARLQSHDNVACSHHLSTSSRRPLSASGGGRDGRSVPRGCSPFREYFYPLTIRRVGGAEAFKLTLGAVVQAALLVLFALVSAFLPLLLTPAALLITPILVVVAVGTAWLTLPVLLIMCVSHTPSRFETPSLPDTHLPQPTRRRAVGGSGASSRPHRVDSWGYGWAELAADLCEENGEADHAEDDAHQHAPADSADASSDQGSDASLKETQRATAADAQAPPTRGARAAL